MSLLSCLIGLIQMTIVMLTAGLIARWLQIRSPHAAANVGLIGLLTGLSLMLMTLFNSPRVFETHLAAHSDVTSMSSTSNASPPANRFHEDVLKASDPQPNNGLALRDAMQWIGLRLISNTPHDWPLMSWAWWAVLFVPFLATLPIIVGLLGTIQLHRVSIPIRNDDVMTRCVNADLRFKKCIAFRRSEVVAAPCVTLYGGRTIYLPLNWAQWSDAELAAAIAHEAAHLRRNDPEKRLVTQLATSLQLFHPLAIWLRRGVMLSQEMAADRDAARTQGDRFAISLSRMALRIDSVAEASSRFVSLKQLLLRPGVVSVSSSHLIRRIEMLTTYPNGCGTKQVGILPQAALIGVFAVCAGWTVRADQPTGEATASNAATERIASLSNRTADKRTEPYSSPHFSPWDELCPGDQGFFAIRVEKLLNHPQFGSLLPSVLDPFLDTGWKWIATDQAREQRAALGLTIQNVRHLIGTMTFTIVNTEPEEDSETNGSYTVASDGGTVRFRKPVDHDPIRAAIDVHRIVRGAEANGIEPGDFGEKTTEEFFNELLSNTFTEGAKQRDLVLMPPDKGFDKHQLARLKRGWNAVEGGWLAASYSLPTSIGFVENKEDELAEQLVTSAACMAVGIDFATGAEPAHVRVVFVPRENVSPTELDAVTREFVKAGQVEIERVIAGGDSEEIESLQIVREVLRSHQVELARSSDGVDIDCVLVTLRLPLDMPQLFDWL